MWTDQPAEDSPCVTPSSTPVQSSIFQDFTYVSPSFMNEHLIEELRLKAGALSMGNGKRH